MITTTTAARQYVAVHVTGDDRMYCPSYIRTTVAQAAADPASWTPAMPADPDAETAAETVVAELVTSPAGDQIMGYAVCSPVDVMDIFPDRADAIADATRRLEFGDAVRVATVCALDEPESVLSSVRDASDVVGQLRVALATAEDVRDDAVRAALADGYSGASIAELTGVTEAPISEQRVSQIRRGGRV